MIAIQADGGQSIGMGHIVRCLSLAQEIRRLGEKVCFISKIEEGIQRVRHDGLDVFTIKETEETFELIDKHEIKVLIVDSYNVDNVFFSKLRRRLKKLVYIDDINAFGYDVDIIINYNANAKIEDYFQIHKNTGLLLGTQYALLRRQYQNIAKRNINKEAEEILITNGSTDCFSTVPFLLKTIVEDGYFTDKRINVVIGQGFRNIDLIRDIAKGIKNIMLFENLSDLSDLMLSADIAISAGGSTLYELCACGTPSLSYIIADNQEKSAQALSEQGIIECLGWHNKLSIDMIAKKIKSLCNDYEKRKELSFRMQKLVDGKGAQRVAEEIVGNGYIRSEKGDKNV